MNFEIANVADGRREMKADEPYEVKHLPLSIICDDSPVLPGEIFAKSSRSSFPAQLFGRLELVFLDFKGFPEISRGYLGRE